jgi:uncharacterized membrane protein
MNSIATWLAVVTTFILAAGQILFKMSTNRLALESKQLSSIVLVPEFHIALVLYAAGTLTWIYVLQNSELSKVYPISALAFFLVPVFSSIFFGEEISLRVFIGAFVIAIGVIISVN